MPKFILQDNATEFKNEQLMSVFEPSVLNIFYTKPYYPKGNSKVENVHNFLKSTIAKFTYGSQLEWDAKLTLATDCYNIIPSVNDLESPFNLVHGRDTFEGRLSKLQNYCRYLGTSQSD